MGEHRDLASIGQRWSGWARIIATAIALAAIFGLGTVFYNEVWQSKILTYTILPTYDLGGQFFTGLVIENRGRASLTDVQIILSELDAPMISDPHMPGPHEYAELVSGGQGQNEARIEMPRLSEGASLSIYILTPDEMTLEEGTAFFVSSKETAAVSSGEEVDWFSKSLAIFFFMVAVTCALILERRMKRQFEEFDEGLEKLRRKREAAMEVERRELEELEELVRILEHRIGTAAIPESETRVDTTSD